MAKKKSHLVLAGGDGRALSWEAIGRLFKELTGREPAPDPAAKAEYEAWLVSLPPEERPLSE